MSSLLEQAIIDANALKEAAVKNAEVEILEKYSQEIKEAVNALLEQTDEEDFLDDEFSVSAPMSPSPSDEDLLDQIPNADTDGKNLCPCPDDDEMIEINLTELVEAGLGKAVTRGTGAGLGALAGGALGSAAGPVGTVVGAGIGSAVGDWAGEKMYDAAADDEEEEEAVEEVLDINEEDLAGLVEELTFEASTAAPNGWASSPTAEIEEAQEVERVRQELEEKNSENKELKEQVSKHEKQTNKFKRIVLELKDKLDEVSLENARFLYTNRVLKSASLNERQKDKIVESICSAKTIEEAKVIFETLQSTVDSSSHKRKPKSLDEAVARKSSILYHNREQRNVSDPAVERMQRLAGIHKN
jgi:hypothetical protein